MRQVVFAAIIVCSMPSSSANARTGNELLSQCTTSTASQFYWQDRAGCAAFIEGFVEGATSFQEMWPQSQRKMICVPQGVTTGQIRDVVVKWLAQHPEFRHN